MPDPIKAGMPNPFLNQESRVVITPSTYTQEVSDSMSITPTISEHAAEQAPEGIQAGVDYEKQYTDQGHFFGNTLGFLNQVGGEIIGGTIGGAGTIYEMAKYLVDKKSRDFADFNNAVIQYGEDIKQKSRDEAPIVRANPNKSWDVTDSGWWFENGVSMASTISLMLPALGATKGLGLLAEVSGATRLAGKTTRYLTELATSSALMRNAENFQESLSVVNNTRADALAKFSNMSQQEYSDYLNNTEIGKEYQAHGGTGDRNDLANYVAAQAGWGSYKVNSANIVFDALQLHGALKIGSGLTRTGVITSEVAEAQAKAIGKKWGIGEYLVNKAANTYHIGYGAASEAVEEMINYVGEKEGTRKGKALIDKGTDTEDGIVNIAKRFGNEYVNDPKMYEQGFWGFFGGAVFEGVAGRVMNRNERQKGIADKLEEINNRKNVLEGINQQVAGINADKTLTEAEKAQKLDGVVRTIGFDLGVKASQVGSADLLEKHLSSPQGRKSIIEELSPEVVSTLGEQGVNTFIDSIKKQANDAEKTYGQFYNQVITAPVSEKIKRQLTAAKTDLALGIQTNKDKIDELNNQLSLLQANNLNATDSTYQLELEKAANNRAIAAIRSGVRNGKLTGVNTNDIMSYHDQLMKRNEEITQQLKESSKDYDSTNYANQISDNEADIKGEAIFREGLVSTTQQKLKTLTNKNTAERLQMIENLKEATAKAKAEQEFETGLAEKVKNNAITVEELNQIKATNPEKTTVVDKYIKEIEDKNKIKEERVVAEEEREKPVEVATPVAEKEDTKVEPIETEEDLGPEVTTRDVERELGAKAVSFKRHVASIENEQTIEDKIAEIDGKLEVYRNAGFAENGAAIRYMKQWKQRLLAENKTTEVVEPVLAEIVEPIVEPITTVEEVVATVHETEPTIVNIAVSNEAVELVVEQTEAEKKAEINRKRQETRKRNQAIKAEQARLAKEAEKTAEVVEETVAEVVAEEPVVVETEVSKLLPVIEEVEVALPVVVEQPIAANANLYVDAFRGMKETPVGYQLTSDTANVIEALQTMQPDDEVELFIDTTNPYHRDNEDNATIAIRKNGVIVGYLNTVFAITKELDNEQDDKFRSVLVENLAAVKRIRKEMFANKSKIYTSKVTRITSGTKIESTWGNINERIVGEKQLYFSSPDVPAVGRITTLVSSEGPNREKQATTTRYDEDDSYDGGAFYLVVNSFGSKKDDVNTKSLLRLRVNTLQTKDVDALSDLMFKVIDLFNNNDKIDFAQNDTLNQLREAISNITAFNKNNVNADGTIPQPIFKIHQDRIEFLYWDMDKDGNKVKRYVRMYFNKETGIPVATVHEWNGSKSVMVSREEFKNSFGKPIETISFDSKNKAKSVNRLKEILSNRQYNINKRDVLSGKIKPQELYDREMLQTDTGVLTDKNGEPISNFINKDGGDKSSNLVLSISSEVKVQSVVETKVVKVAETVQETKIIEEVEQVKTEPKKESKFSKFEDNEDLGLDDFDLYQLEGFDSVNTSVDNIKKYATKLSELTGVPVEFVNDNTLPYKGKLENGKAIINLAKATLDTAIHEIFGHSFVRVLRQQHEKTNSKIYSNLLNELETETGKKILEQVKKNYTELTENEQKEEAIVQLISKVVAEQQVKKFEPTVLGAVKRFIELVKKKIKQLFNINNEVDVNSLPDSFTLKDVIALTEKKVNLTIANFSRTVYEKVDLPFEQHNIDDYVNHMVLRVAQFLTINDNVTNKMRKENPARYDVKRVVRGLLTKQGYAYEAAGDVAGSDEIVKILDNYDKLWELTKDMVSRKLNVVVEEIETETEGGATRMNKNWDDSLAYANSQKDSFDSDLKRIIMTTPKVRSFTFDLDENGNRVVNYDNEVDNPAKLYTGLEFNKIYPYLQVQMANANSIEQMMDRLYEMRTVEPSLMYLWEKINKSSLLQAKWFANFNRTFLEASHHRATELEDGGFNVVTDTSNKEFSMSNKWIRSIDTLIEATNKDGSYYNAERQVEAATLLQEIKQYENKTDEVYANKIAKLADILGLYINPEHVQKLITNQHAQDSVADLSGRYDLAGNTTNLAQYLFENKLASLYNTLFKPILLKNDKVKIKFNNYGDLNTLATYLSYYDYETTENSFINTEGNVVYSYAKPSYITDTFDIFRRLDNPFDTNKEQAKEEVLNWLKQYAQDPSMQVSNWLWTNGGRRGFINKTGKGVDVNTITVNDVNWDVIKKFKLIKSDGLKNPDTGLGANYAALPDTDWELYTLFEYLAHSNRGVTAGFTLPILSDSSNSYSIIAPRMQIAHNGVLIRNVDEVDITHPIFIALKNLAYQEMARMEQAKNLLFEFKDGKYVPKEDLNQEIITNLETKYHYQKLDANNKPILIDSNGMPTGNVFKFDALNYEDMGKTVSMNDIVLLRTNGLYDKQSHNAAYEAALNDYIKGFIVNVNNAEQKYYAKYKNLFLASKNKLGDMTGVYLEYEDMIREFVFNNYIFNAEYFNFFQGTMDEYKNAKDTNKRAKEVASPKQTVGTLFRGSHYSAIILKDIETTHTRMKDMIKTVGGMLKNEFEELKGLTYGDKLNKKGNALEKKIYDILNKYETTNIADAQGYVTVPRYKAILKDYGRWDRNYELLFDKVERGEELKADELNRFLQVLKPFSYGRTFNPILNKMVSRQIKTSLMPLVPQLYKGTELEKLVKHIEEHNKKEGVVAIGEVYFQSAVKVGAQYISNIADGNGKLLENFGENIQPIVYDNASWGLQLDVPSHLKDEKNKLGVQVTKIVFSNLSNEAIYNGMTGDELRDHFFDLLGANIEDDAQALIDRLGVEVVQNENGDDEYQFKDLQTVRQILVEELRSRGASTNYEDALEIGMDGKFNMPLFVNNMAAKYQSILSSLFTNNVTNQKFPGGHAVIGSRAFMSPDVKWKDDENIDLTKIGVEYHKDVAIRVQTGEFKLAPPYIDDNGYHVAEVLLPAWSKQFFDKVGNRLSINELSEEARTMIGYRIPTEAKYSLVVFKVVGFLPESMDSTVILPHELVTTTGWDMDVDSLYIMWQNLVNVGGRFDTVAYLNDKNSTVEERYKLAEAEAKENRFDTEELNEYLNGIGEKTLVTLRKDGESKETLLGKNASIIKKFLQKEDGTWDIEKIKEINKSRYNKHETDASLEDKYEGTELAVAKVAKQLITKFNESYKAGKLEDFKLLPVVRQNSRKARENKMFDVIRSVLTNKQHFKESITPGNFDDAAELRKVTEEILGIGSDNLNPLSRKGQNFFRSANVSGMSLKGLAANANSLFPILQSLKAKLRNDLAFVVDYVVNDEELEVLKERYQNQLSIKGRQGEKTRITIRHSNIAHSPNGDFLNVNGDVTTAHAAQLLAMVLDIVKEGFPYNINTETFNTFIAMVGTGIDIRTAGMFINQPILRKYMDKVMNSKSIINSSAGREFEATKKEYQTVLTKIRYLQGLISQDEALKKKLIVKKGGVISYTYKLMSYQRKSDNRLMDAVTMLGYNPDEVRSWTLKELENMLHKANPNVWNGDIENMSQEDLRKLEEWYKDQLLVLERYNVYKKVGDAMSNINTVFSTDKMGAGPNMSVTDNWWNAYEQSLASFDRDETGNFLPAAIVDENNEAITMSVFAPEAVDKDKSAYSMFETYLQNSNLLSLKVLNSLFLDRHNTFLRLKTSIRKTIRGVKTTLIDKQINNYLNNALMSRLSYFDNFNKESVLGVNKDVVINLDITKDNSSLEQFDKLSTANKLMLVQKQLPSDDKYNFLSYLVAELQEKEIAAKGFHRIKFNKPSSSDGIDNYLTDSFNKLYNSDNEYIKSLMKDLIAYDYFTTTLSYSVNGFSSYIPVKILNNSEIQLGENLYNLYDNLDREYLDDQTVVDRFFQNNWNNKLIVPRVYTKLLRDAETLEYVQSVDENGNDLEGVYETKDSTPRWSSHSATSVMSISKKELRNESKEVKNSSYLLATKKVGDQFVSTLFKRFDDGTSLSDEKVNDKVYYYPISKLSNKFISLENNDNSVFEKQNVPHSMDYFESQLEEIAFGIEENKAKESGEKDCSN